MYLRYYKFKDEVHADRRSFGTRSQTPSCRAGCWRRRGHGSPVDGRGHRPSCAGRQHIINAVYTEQIELLPTKFYPWQFKMNVEAFDSNMPSSGDVAAPGR